MPCPIVFIFLNRTLLSVRSDLVPPCNLWRYSLRAVRGSRKNEPKKIDKMTKNILNSKKVKNKNSGGIIVGVFSHTIADVYIMKQNKNLEKDMPKDQLFGVLAQNAEINEIPVFHLTFCTWLQNRDLRLSIFAHIMVYLAIGVVFSWRRNRFWSLARRHKQRKSSCFEAFFGKGKSKNGTNFEMKK